MNEFEVFSSALELADSTARSRYLDEACVGHPDLRSRIEALLRNASNASRYLEMQPHAILDSIDGVTAESIGTQIGPYKLFEQIGEGGMGLVYMAEQQRPVRRLVALKIIKPGMDSKQVIARFEAERQVLAMMDHPSIAKVFDAGTTETGRPYFVMELVRGLPITEFCDQQGLSVRERLELFVQVCQAVQHAHQKGIIHRDLKPTNVLVTLADTVPVPKVIDFGIAKALGQQLTEHTLHTGFAQLVGTPLYMSPEQAELNQLGVDTRSDVYSLGVLLYELLTGTTPFDKATLNKAGLDEIRRLIREVEPPRPSARLSTLGFPAVSTISERRNIDPRRISTALRGELDWIAMKALEKDRSRRYESASALAADIQRYLHDEPVQACTPSTAYRFRKFARKHKAAISTAAIVAAALFLGTAISLWQALRATAAEAQAIANEAKAKREEQKALSATGAERDAKEAEAAQRKQAEKNFESACEAVDRMLAGVGSDQLRDIPRIQPIRRQMLQGALDFYNRFIAESGESPELRFRAARVWIAMAELCSIDLGDYHEAEVAQQAALAILEKLVAETPINMDYRATLTELQSSAGWHYEWANPQYEKAEKLFREANAGYELLARDQPQTSRWLVRQSQALRGVGRVLADSGKKQDAIVYFCRSLKLLDQTGEDHPVEYAITWRELAEAREQNDPFEADRCYRLAIAEFRLLSEIKNSHDRKQFADLLLYAGRHLAGRQPDKAETLLRESMDLYRGLCDDYPDNPHARTALVGNVRELARALLANIGPNENPSAANIAEMESLYDDAIRVSRRLVADFANPRYKLELADALRDKCQFLLGTDRVAPPEDVSGYKVTATARKEHAQTALAEALEICRQLVASAPKDASFVNQLTAFVGLYTEHFGELSASELPASVSSEQSHPEVIEARQLAAAAPIGDSKYRTNLCQYLLKKSQRLHDANKRIESLALLSEAIVVGKQLVAEEPNNPDHRDLLVALLFNQRSCLRQIVTKFDVWDPTSYIAEIDRVCAEWVAVSRQRATDFPDRPQYRASVAFTRIDEAKRLWSSPDRLVVAKLLEEAIEIQRQLTVEFPENTNFRDRLREWLQLQSRYSAGAKNWQEPGK